MLVKKTSCETKPTTQIHNSNWSSWDSLMDPGLIFTPLPPFKGWRPHQHTSSRQMSRVTLRYMPCVVCVPSTHTHTRPIHHKVRYYTTCKVLAQIRLMSYACISHTCLCYILYTNSTLYRDIWRCHWYFLYFARMIIWEEKRGKLRWDHIYGSDYKWRRLEEDHIIRHNREKVR